MLVFFPGCFFLLSLVLAMVVVAFVEQDEASVREAKCKEEEFVQILEVMKRKEEEEEVRGTFCLLCFYLSHSHVFSASIKIRRMKMLMRQ